MNPQNPVKVDISIQENNQTIEGIYCACFITEESINNIDRTIVFNSIEEVLEYGFSEDSNTFKFSELYFGQSLKPPYLVIRFKRSSESYVDAYLADNNSSFLYITIESKSLSDVDGFSLFNESQNKLFFTSIANDELGEQVYEALLGRVNTVIFYYYGSATPPYLRTVYFDWLNNSNLFVIKEMGFVYSILNKTEKYFTDLSYNPNGLYVDNFGIYGGSEFRVVATSITDYENAPDNSYVAIDELFLSALVFNPTLSPENISQVRVSGSGNIFAITYQNSPTTISIFSKGGSQYSFIKNIDTTIFGVTFDDFTIDEDGTRLAISSINSENQVTIVNISDLTYTIYNVFQSPTNVFKVNLKNWVGDVVLVPTMNRDVDGYKSRLFFLDTVTGSVSQYGLLTGFINNISYDENKTKVAFTLAKEEEENVFTEYLFLADIIYDEGNKITGFDNIKETTIPNPDQLTITFQLNPDGTIVAKQEANVFGLNFYSIDSENNINLISDPV